MPSPPNHWGCASAGVAQSTTVTQFLGNAAAQRWSSWLLPTIHDRAAWLLTRNTRRVDPAAVTITRQSESEMVPLVPREITTFRGIGPEPAKLVRIGTPAENCRPTCAFIRQPWAANRDSEPSITESPTPQTPLPAIVPVGALALAGAGALLAGA